MNELIELSQEIIELKASGIKRNRSEKETTNNLKKYETMGVILNALEMIVETRDSYTAHHQQRVANLAYAIAKEMSISQERIDEIHMAALIHDIGKLYIPVEILKKTDRLNKIEFDIIKIHPQVSFEILKTIEFPWPILQIVLQHHERMDGSGYPDGLAGEDILLEARILAVADVVEAISLQRPYRIALGIERALKEISQNKRILYDPRVVDAFLKLCTKKGFKFDQVMKVKTSYNSLFFVDQHFSQFINNQNIPTKFFDKLS